MWWCSGAWFLGAFTKLQKRLLVSSCLSVWNNSAPTGWFFVNFGVRVFFENVSTECKFYYNLTRITGTLHRDICTFMIISDFFLE